jgi:outer membrane biosynthesis protein TonB
LKRVIILRTKVKNKEKSKVKSQKQRKIKSQKSKTKKNQTSKQRKIKSKEKSKAKKKDGIPFFFAIKIGKLFMGFDIAYCLYTPNYNIFW